MSFGFGFSLPAYAGYAAGFGPSSFGSGTSLALDFLNGNNTLDPRITFSRTTNATLTNSAGLVANAPMNLLTFSEQFDNAAWAVKTNISVAANSTSAPDGTVTADKMVENTLAGGHGVYQTAGVFTVGVVQAVSVYAKAGERSWLFVTFANDSNLGAWFNVSAGTVGTRQSSNISAAIVDAGNGWYRCTITFSPTKTNPYLAFYMGTADGTSSYTGDGVSGLFLWGAQLELGSTATTYNPTTVKNLLGFTENFDNAAWTKSNAFVQTNLLTYSQDFDNAAWTDAAPGSTVTVTANSSVAPDGSTTADTLAPNVGGTNAMARQVRTLAASTAYAGSLYIKAGTSTQSRVLLRDTAAGTNFADATINWSGGVPSIAGGATGTWTVAFVNNGWYRLVGFGNSGATASPLITFSVFPDASAGTGNLLVWGAQLVQGTSAGDYKATYAAAAPVGYTDIYGQPFAQKLVENTANNFHGVNVLSTLIAGTTYTQSVYAKAGERSWMAMTEGNNVTASAWFNLSNGTVGTVNGTGSPSASITDVGNGWYRCSLRFTPIAAAGNTQARVATGDGVSSYTGDGTSGIYIFGAQLSDSASVDPYVYNPVAAPSSVAYYGPRFDYDPVTLAPKGLLIEEQRTNLLTYSEQFDNAAWIKQQATVTANAVVAPDGTTTADKLVEDSTANIHRAIQVSTTTAVPTTFTVYAKAAERTWCYLANASSSQAAYFNLSAGVVGIVVGATTASMTPVGNGWYRCAITSTPAAGAQTYAVYIATANGSFTYTGNGTSGLFIWGAQLEAGAFATSYIPTVASQVTRAADSASMIGNNFARWYNVNEGTVFSNTLTLAAGVDKYNWEIGDGTANNRFAALGQTGNQDFYTITGGAIQANSNLAISRASAIKMAGAYKTNDVIAAYNGTLGAADTSVVLPIPNALYLGSARTSLVPLNGTIARFAYYNRRLSNTELQGITS